MEAHCPHFRSSSVDRWVARRRIDATDARGPVDAWAGGRGEQEKISVAKARNEAPFALNPPLPLPELVVPPERRSHSAAIALTIVLLFTVGGLAMWLLGGS